MVVVGMVAFLHHRRMDGHIRDHALADEGLLDERQKKFFPLVGIQLMRERQIDFTGELRVLAPFHPLDMIPEFLAVVQEGRPTPGYEDFGIHDTAPTTVVVRLLRPVIPDLLARPVSCGRKRRSPPRPANDLHREVVARHATRVLNDTAIVN